LFILFLIFSEGYMKIIFVGMHNKPMKMPLCSSTKSGKLVNRIIEALKPIECQKTNLYDVEYYPKREEKFNLAMNWHERIEPKLGDVIVLMGAEVHENYVQNMFDKVVKIAHPSSKRSHEAMNEYVISAVEKIKNKINNVA
jgi:hypothetical protein